MRRAGAWGPNQTMAQDKSASRVPPDLPLPPPIDADSSASSEGGPSLAPPPAQNAVPSLPPPLPKSEGKARKSKQAQVPPSPAADPNSGEPTQRRAARRRPAGPSRGQVAANDDVPSIGGLIYALDQKPDSTPFRYAIIASGVWG